MFLFIFKLITRINQCVLYEITPLCMTLRETSQKIIKRELILNIWVSKSKLRFFIKYYRDSQFFSCAIMYFREFFFCKNLLKFGVHIIICVIQTSVQFKYDSPFRIRNIWALNWHVWHVWHMWAIYKTCANETFLIPQPK